MKKNSKPKTKSFRKLWIFLKILMFIGLIGLAVFLIHHFIYSLSPFFGMIEAKFQAINDTVKKELISGLSIGALLLVFVAFILPLLIKNVDKKEYLKSLQRGILSSAIFYTSNTLYQFLENLSQTFLIIFIVLVILVVIVLTEVILTMKKKEHEISERSKIMASIVAGLLFGIILKLLQFSYQWIKYLF